MMDLGLQEDFKRRTVIFMNVCRMTHSVRRLFEPAANSIQNAFLVRLRSKLAIKLFPELVSAAKAKMFAI